VTPTNRCLDGETLAAWVEGGLSRTDATMAEAHVSSCPRCQEIAGLIVKTTPVTVVDAPWWRKRAAWLVPVAAGVAAAGLLMIAPTNPAPGPAPPPAAPARESPRTAATPAAPPVAPLAETRAADRKSAETRPAETKPSEIRKERQREERANTAVAGAAAPAPAAPPAAASAAGPPAAAAGGLADEQSARQTLAKTAAKQAVSPDGALHWRITDRGALERSTDGGTTWQAVNVGVTATFTTIQAPEPRTALVTTTDGRVFRSLDGGATWQLQERRP
jgi:hypothetical protein